MQMAYPGVNSSLINHVGIDLFIVALNDRDLEYEVLKRDPTCLQEAANYAIKLEVYWQSLTAPVSANRGGGRMHSQSRNVFAVADEPEASSTGEATLLKCLEQIEKQLEKVAKVFHSTRLPISLQTCPILNRRLTLHPTIWRRQNFRFCRTKRSHTLRRQMTSWHGPRYLVSPLSLCPLLWTKSVNRYP